MGRVWQGEEGDNEGVLGSVVVNSEGKGSLVGEVGWGVLEMVGRGILVQKLSGADGAQPQTNDTVLGVVARSAGIWENEKVVCACSGKTVWEEREEMVGKGIV
jgi:copper chaperone for superoxide dismutase